jgi:hypothetical protein
MISLFVVFGLLKFPSGACPVRGEGFIGVICHSALWPLYCHLDFEGGSMEKPPYVSPKSVSEAVFLCVCTQS